MSPSTDHLDQDVICPECRTVFTVRGIGVHRRYKHPETFVPGIRALRARRRVDPERRHAEKIARAEARLARLRADAASPPEGGDSDE